MKQLATLLVLVFSLLLGLTGSAPAQTQIKLTTTQAGIYRVTTNQLATALGLSPLAAGNLIATGNLTLLNQGQTNSWLPAADNSQLTFYAQAYNNNYTTNNVYWLVPGTNLPMASVNAANPAAQTNEYYLCTRNFELDSTNYARYDLVKNPETNYWFWTQLSGGTRKTLPSFSFTNSGAFDAVGPTNVPSQFNVRLMAVTQNTVQSVTLVLNGKTDIAWTANWLDNFVNNLLATPTNFTFTIPTPMLKLGPSNVFTFQDNSSAGVGSVWLMDGFTVQYPRQYLAVNGSLQCSANSNTVVTLQGFTNSNVTVLDITQPQTPLLVNNLNVESASGSWRASLVPQQQNASYAACQLGSELDVAGLEAIMPVGLASGTNRGAFIIIAAKNLIAAAQPLANYRNAQGLETLVVSLESVYNEFDNGLREPKAISNFLAYAGQNWTVKPAYALLVGKGTYDYRNLTGCGDNLVPPLMIASIYGLVASDSQYGQIGNVAGPQISVGRFSVTNAAQVTNLIVKLKAYETNGPQARKALLLAEFSDSAGDFQSDMGAVQTVLAPSFSTTAILPSNTASNAATMRTNLLTGLNAGTDLLDYLGHGATVALGNEFFFTNAEVAYLTSTRLPLISAMCCYIGKFNIPGAQCLSEALVLATNTGAIASLSATGESLNPEGTQLNLNLMTNFVSGLPGRLGDYVRQAMVSYNQVSRFTPSGMYNLIG
ncbi:MAG: C25 family cysteine peptidase, partial [Verrucomicrobiota bacterium]